MRSTPILLATLLGLLLTGCDKPPEEQQRDSMSGPQESPQQDQVVIHATGRIAAQDLVPGRAVHVDPLGQTRDELAESMMDEDLVQDGVQHLG